MAAELDIIIKAVDQASKQLDEVKNGLKGMKEEGERSHKILGMVGTGLEVLGGMAAAAASSIAAFGLASVKSFADVGDELDKMSIRTGVSVEELSKLRYAADIANVPMTTLENSLKRTAVAVTELREGNKETTEAFKRLGLSVDVFKEKKPDEAFFIIADKVRGIKDPLEKAAVAVQIFGKSGTDLLPLLSEDLGNLKKEAEKLGIVFDKDMTEKAAKWKDENTRLHSSLQGLQFTIGSELTPLITPLIERVTEAITKFKDWYEAMGGFEGIKEKVKSGLGELIEKIDVNTGLITALKDAWTDIKLVWDNEVRPALDELWVAIEPYLPTLKEWAKIIGMVLLGALHLLVLFIKITLLAALYALKWIIDKIIDAVNWCAKAWDWLTDQLAKVVSWAEKVAEKFWAVVNAVKEAIKAISSFSISGAIGALFGKGGEQKGSKQIGGYIPETGTYLLHKGEYVVPSPKFAGVGAGIVYNITFTGNTFLDQDVPEKIGDMLIKKLGLNYKL